jgi:hypothetical protein
MIDRETLVYVDLDGVPHLMGRLLSMRGLMSVGTGLRS